MPADPVAGSSAAYYRVSVGVDDDIAEEWLAWMRTIHVPEVLATGCFTGCTFTRQVEPESRGRRQCFLLEYGLATLDQFKAYEVRHAARLREAHSARYSGQFEASRSIAILVDRLAPSTP